MGASVGVDVGVNGAGEYIQSLKNVTAETKAFQSELKALQSSFDKSWSTWDKSQATASVLSGEIQAQYQKISGLKDAQDKFAEGSTQWWDYADKINKATIALNEMEKQLKELPNHIQAIGQDFEKWGEQIESAGKTVSKVGDTLTKKVSAPIVGGLTAAVKETADFDTAMSEVKAVAITTQETLGRISAEEGIAQFDTLREKAREMGRETVFSATESANAMSYLARAGWTVDEIMNGVDGVMALAAADGLDLATTAGIVADGVTAFGKSADYASTFADILAMTSAQSNTNVEMLGDSFKYVAPTAAALGYEVEDVALALGLSANAGVKASQAGTGLRQALKNLISPTDTVANAAEQFGISLYDAQGGALPLSEVITQLRTTFGDLDVAILDENGDLKDGEALMAEYGDSLPISQQEKLQAIVDIFGTRAMPTMLSIINASVNDFNSLEEALYNTSGAAQAMADTRLDNVAGDFTLLKDEVLDLAISFGDIMVPILRNDVIPIVRDVIGWFAGLDDGTKEMIVKVGLLAAAVGPVLSIGGRLISGIGTVTGGVGKLLQAVGGLAGTGASVAGGIGTITTAVTGGGGLIGGLGALASAAAPFLAGGAVVLGIAAAVGLIIFAGYELVKHWDDIKEAAGKLKDWVGEKFDGLKESCSKAWDGITTVTSHGWEAAKKTWNDSMTEVHNAYDKHGGGLVGLAAAAMEGIHQANEAGFNLLNNLTDGKLDGIKKLWDGTFHNIVDGAFQFGRDAMDFLGKGFDIAWSWVSRTVSGIGDSITSTFSGLAKSALSWGSDMMSNLSDGIGKGISWVKDKASSVASTIGSFLHFSEPDVGPLSNFHTFMPDMMKQLAGGIYQNMGLVERASDALASALLPDVDTGTFTAGRGNSTTITNGDMVVNVYGAEGQDVRELARIVEQEITFNMNRRSAAYA